MKPLCLHRLRLSPCTLSKWSSASSLSAVKTPTLMLPYTQPRPASLRISPYAHLRTALLLIAPYAQPRTASLPSASTYSVDSGAIKSASLDPKAPTTGANGLSITESSRPNPNRQYGVHFLSHPSYGQTKVTPAAAI